MIPVSWLKMRLILLCEALLLGSGAVICSLFGGCFPLPAADLGIFTALLLAATLFLLRVEAAPENENSTMKQLRRQRHDIINHLQVIYGFLQLGKTDRALEYIDGVFQKGELL